MDAFVGYLIDNWALILVLLAFIITLKITVFLDKKTVIRMYVLIVSVFLLSIIVFTEFYLAKTGGYVDVRTVLMAIRYSATPIIISYILFTLAKKKRWYLIVPALVVAIINIISIFTGIVFSLNDSGELQRGFLGFLPYVAVGVYSVVLIFSLIWESNKQLTEIIPILFLAFVFISGLIFPFVVGKEYLRIFCTTIAIALFVYYVFQILQLTKKDSLTGLFNRHAYYVAIKNNSKDITAIVSIDMNGLKTINDNDGHQEGDRAIMTLADCFVRSVNRRQLVYRIGGDEFIIICWRTSKDELNQLISNIKEKVSETKYSCSIGCYYSSNGEVGLDEMIKKSDDMMYEDKANYYSKTGRDRRVK